MKEAAGIYQNQKRRYKKMHKYKRMRIAAFIMSILLVGTAFSVSACKTKGTSSGGEVSDNTGVSGNSDNKSDDKEQNENSDKNSDENSDRNSDGNEGASGTDASENIIDGNTSQGDTQNNTNKQGNVYENMQNIALDSSWEYADYSMINSGSAVMYKAASDRKNITVAVNAGHGTSGGSSVRTLCHPDGSPKTTGGSTAQGATTATAVSGGMTFYDGTPESSVTLRMAQILRDTLLAQGYDVLMLRDDTDVQLDNVARSVIANNTANCHIALHWDGDGLSYDKGVFYIAVPDGIKNMQPVATYWQEHDRLGESLVSGLSNQGVKVCGSGKMSIDLTQTSYSTIPSVDIELGNASSDHSEETLNRLAAGLLEGINSYYN